MSEQIAVTTMNMIIIRCDYAFDMNNQSINISFIQKGTLQRTLKYSYSYT